MRAALAEISLSAVRHNLALVQAKAAESQILAIVKADGYGHGLEAIAQTLARAPRPVDAFGVASIDDAVRLRASGIVERIVLLSGFDEISDLVAIQELKLDCVIHHDSQISMLERAPQIAAAKPIRAWLKLDSGMRRLGFFPDQFALALQRLRALSLIDTEIVLMSHFAQADAVGRKDSASERIASAQTDAQINYFDRVIAASVSSAFAHRQLQSEANPQSLANSGAILSAPLSHRQWIRPGGVLYGLSTHDQLTGAELGFQPAMRLSTRLVSVKTIQAGDAIGYGGSFIAPCAMRIGIAAIGYGDGYPRHVATGTPVRVAGHLTRILGRVSMDLLSVDLSHFPLIDVGAEVLLWGEELPVETIARAAETISYELTCGVTKRVRFSYMGGV